jgi:hypothetical protein
VGTEVFYKLDALGLLLPKLDVPIFAGRDEKVLARYCRVRDMVAVHVALFVHFRAGKPLQVELLELQH